MWEHEEAERQRILCHYCGFKVEFEKYTSFEPSLKVVYSAVTRGVWTVGTKYVLKGRNIDDPFPYDCNAALEIVDKNTTIPVPIIAMQWIDGKKVYTLMKRIPGQSLESLIDQKAVTHDDKDRYARETAAYLNQLHRLTADTVKWFDGKPYEEQLLARGTHIYHGGSEEYFANWSGNQSQREEAEKLLPGTKPFTLTHGDIHAGNVMIYDGHVSGIIDWEACGYVPVWYEYLQMQKTGFGSLVAKYLENQYPDVLALQRRFRKFLEVREDLPIEPRLTSSIRIEGRIVQIPYKGQVGVYRGDRFISAFKNGRKSDEEIPDVDRIDLDKLTLN